ncbi:MAG: hypothetical protein M3N24_03640 [Actinomycetota bacterium]|nr:hypothetical protein [Actinomycetota bacterium]
MSKRRSIAVLGLVTALLLALTPTPAYADPGQHGPTTGHLTGPGAWGDLELVGVERVTRTDDLVADVAVDPRENLAYLANWGEPDCDANSEAGGINSPDAGVWVIDISNPSNPKTINFIPQSQDTRSGEGMQVVRLTTKWFNGYALVVNNEQCGKNGKGGVSLYDVTRPRKVYMLSKHFGDKEPGSSDTNETHSAFAWDAGARAYAVMVDNEEAADVDILDITNPKRPRLIGEFNLNVLAQRQAGKQLFQPELGLLESSLHDMVVKKIGSDWIMLLSYWDGGYVQLNVNNPARPVFIRDTDYNNPDPELLESTGISLPPEGNGHQAEFTLDNRFFIGTDEDFSPYRSIFTVEGLGERPAGEFGWTKPIVTLSDKALNGPTVYGGYGCPQSAPLPPASVLDPYTAPGEDQIVVLQRGPVNDPSQNYEACFFSLKVEAAQNAGYDGVIIANHHTGAGGGLLPDAFICGGQGHQFDVKIPGICIGHKTFHEIFNTQPNYTYPESRPAIGDIGRKVNAEATFDGWGYVHLFDRTVGGTAAELDTYAIPEAHDEDFAFGFGDLTVHEVATSESNWSQAYLSYYSGGMRSIEIQCSNPADKSTCELVETGGYLDRKGNDFWGVETFTKNGTTYVLGSDRDSGLWIFRDTAP